MIIITVLERMIIIDIIMSILIDCLKYIIIIIIIILVIIINIIKDMIIIIIYMMKIIIIEEENWENYIPECFYQEITLMI